jgi:hypothetical protein
MALVISYPHQRVVILEDPSAKDLNLEINTNLQGRHGLVGVHELNRARKGDRRVVILVFLPMDETDRDVEEKSPGDTGWQLGPEYPTLAPQEEPDKTPLDELDDLIADSGFLSDDEVFQGTVDPLASLQHAIPRILQLLQTSNDDRDHYLQKWEDADDEMEVLTDQIFTLTREKRDRDDTFEALTKLLEPLDDDLTIPVNLVSSLPDRESLITFQVSALVNRYLALRDQRPEPEERRG